MKKIMRIGKLDNHNIFVKATFEDGKFSMSGVHGPYSNGNSFGGCGQICMEFEHRNPKDNDKRYSKLTKPEDITFADGWTKEKWLDLLDIWENWHLNDMQAGCEHQRELGWTYEEHHDQKTFKGELCPVCGYSIGSKWLKKDVPQEIIKTVINFPDTDIVPAWI
jgi:hypothetical protein